jgi:hypothetical protein
LSSEAGGILLTLQTARGIILLHAVKRILHPLCVLAQQLQSPKAILPNLREYQEAAKETLNSVIHSPAFYGTMLMPPCKKTKSP